ncbi:GntR family transcriptional regulator [Sphingomonas sp. Leaf412]|uniref:FadR/GntR family transcriptional regulator n=1 Tax=Sphingomonas sp. Leaf412 TaxID=1736370 RepID=UPI0006FB5926|nr:FCD domain-containing protein [Sphingomonas sp. Leaf412]KQT31331.1 GntR family transcriptional regulator [Sphingomonas sp. Leaf412]
MSVVAGGSLVDQAVRSVRAHIRAHDMKVGDTLPGEGQFATELGVSRAVMREAFGALAALKLIDVGNGRRARVGAMDGSVMGTSLDHAVSTAQVSLAEVWDVRRTLEQRTVELAARHRLSADAAEIVDAAKAMQAIGHEDLDALTHHDIRFHQAIARASGNMLFLQIIRSFEPLMRVAVPSAWRTRTTQEERVAVLACHRVLADAIADRDPDAAVVALDQHFSATIGALL